ncbi:unnamed protein product [Parascedosporium putredinis]|uniref:Major facilitator superfamily (MFS) profile domain-containing protein n=1 Tax=Parascedosporium putredinis TaxID=1442378 RepID=A0A9P1GXQ2_9PEZI|nr:unnamed protein product [Parascedosporium putredinis]CAI7989247.1 unnamed protein product [Parascedosporium putredinis]
MPATSSAVAANAADESTPLLRDAPGVNGISEAGPSSAGDVEGAGDGEAAAEPEGIPDVAARMHLLLPAIGIGIFLCAMDQMLTVASYAKIGSDLNALNSTSWVATAYFLTLTSFQPLYGKLSDIFGRKECLLFSYTVFALGCLGCGLARDMTQLCVSRAVAGIGGGGMNSVVSILISDIVPLRDRGVWQGYLNIIFAAGTSTGAPLGGFLADSIGWRWSFLGQVPLCVLAFASVSLFLHLPRKDHAHWREKSPASTSSAPPSSSPPSPPCSPASTPAPTAAGRPGPLHHRLRYPPRPLHDFRRRRVPRRRLHHPPHRPVLLGHRRRLHHPLSLCAPLMAAIYARSTPGVVLGLAMTALGAGCGITTTLVALLSNALPEDTAVVVACSYLFRSLGSSIGISVSSAVLQNVLRTELRTRLGDGDAARQIEESVRKDLRAIADLPAAVAADVRESYRLAVGAAMGPTIIVLAFAVVATFFIREKSMRK